MFLKGTPYGMYFVPLNDGYLLKRVTHNVLSQLVGHFCSGTTVFKQTGLSLE